MTEAGLKMETAVERLITVGGWLVIEFSVWLTSKKKEERTMPTRRAIDRPRSAEERMKTAEDRLRLFIERSERQYSPQERSENKLLLLAR
jgi:hypothetical protein